MPMKFRIKITNSASGEHILGYVIDDYGVMWVTDNILEATQTALRLRLQTIFDNKYTPECVKEVSSEF